MSNVPPVPRTRVRTLIPRSATGVDRDPSRNPAEGELTPAQASRAPTKSQASALKPQSTHTRKVGKNSPPIHGQIKKGEIRNPRGRPKGAKNTRTLITDAFNQKVSVKGMRGKISLRTLAIIKQVRKAAEGDTKAFQTMLLLEGYSPASEAADAALPARDIPLADKDKAILDFLNKQVREDMMRELQNQGPDTKKKEGGK